jgi:drug/metabolite transporter (DMT)-like permease
MYTRTATIAAYAVMCFIWGTTWLAIKIGLHSIGPLTGVGMRFVFAGAVLYIIAAMRGELRPLRALPWKLIGTLALFTFVLDYSLIYIGETQIESGLVAVLFCTLPFFTFAFSRFMLGEKTPARALAGACIAFAGVAVISISGTIHASIFYSLAVIGAAASAAYANVYTKRYGAIPPLVSLPPAMLLAGVFELAIGLGVEPANWHRAFSPASIGALLYLTVAGTGITFFLLLWLIARLPAGVVGMATLIFPPIALVAGVVFAGEHLAARDIAGSALVLGGMAIALVPLQHASLNRAASRRIRNYSNI